MNKDEYFEEIYCDYYERIYKFIYYKVCNIELAEDLTSDVFVAVYKNLHRYDESKSFILTLIVCLK